MQSLTKYGQHRSLDKTSYTVRLLEQENWTRRDRDC